MVAALAAPLLLIGGGIALACVPHHSGKPGGDASSGTTSAARTPTTTPATPTTADAGDADVNSTPGTAAERLGWGTPLARESDEYNGTRVDLRKWGLFGAGSDVGACSPGYSGHGKRCGTQTTESGGLLRVTGTSDGRTGGLYSAHGSFRYGRIEIRERAVPIGASGEPYHAVPLLFPVTQDYRHGEIDYSERDVGARSTQLFVHHGEQSACSAKVDTTAWHDYAIDWTPTAVTWFIDGREVCTVQASVDAFATSNGGAQMDMFPATGTRMQTAQQQVDWIRFYPTARTQYR